MTGVVSGTAGNVGDDPDTVSANAEHVGVNTGGIDPVLALAREGYEVGEKAPKGGESYLAV